MFHRVLYIAIGFSLAIVLHNDMLKLVLLLLVVALLRFGFEWFFHYFTRKEGYLSFEGKSVRFYYHSVVKFGHIHHFGTTFTGSYLVILNAFESTGSKMRIEYDQDESLPVIEGEVTLGGIAHPITLQKEWRTNTNSGLQGFTYSGVLEIEDELLMDITCQFYARRKRQKRVNKKPVVYTRLWHPDSITTLSNNTKAP